MSKHLLGHYDDAYKKLKAEGFAGWGGEFNSSRRETWRSTVKRLIATKNFPQAPGPILELGCGAGDVALLFAEQGFHVTGVDLSPTAIKWAAAKFSNTQYQAHFFAGDVCELSNLEDASFAALIDGNCLHCILGEARQSLYSEVKRLLKPHGLFYVSSMINDPKTPELKSNFNYKTRLQLENNKPIRYRPYQADLEKELVSQGFKIHESWLTQNPWWDHYHALLSAQ